MNKCTTSALLQGAIFISCLKAAEVTAIQFEDGSGYKFNYQLNNSAEWKFIDLSMYSLIRIYYENNDLITAAIDFKAPKERIGKAI